MEKDYNITLTFKYKMKVKAKTVDEATNKAGRFLDGCFLDDMELLDLINNSEITIGAKESHDNTGK